jgi:hypothetical protein
VRSSRAVAIVLICLGLAACSSVPRPFSPGAKSGGLPPPGPASALIVHPVSGTEGTPLVDLTGAVIAELRQGDVAAIPYDVHNRYRMATQVDAISLTGDDAVLRIIVQFAHPDGAPIAEDDWTRTVVWNTYLTADPILIRALAQEISARMLVVMGLASGNVAEGETGGPSLLIAPILRAPGDGAEALVNAMLSELDRLGLAAEPDDGLADLPVLEALVSVRPVDASNDQVRIVWLLKDRSGRERGRLEQQNNVPSGRLSRRWGVVAQLAASAAAPGVLDLLRRLQGGG